MALSNLPAIHAGIAAQLATASGITNVLLKPPDAPSSLESALMYVVNPRFRRLRNTYGEQSLEWTFDGIIDLPRGNNMRVEDDMGQIVISVIEVSGHDLDAHGALTEGQVLIMNGRTDYGKVSGIDVLRFEFTIVVAEDVSYAFSL